MTTVPTSILQVRVGQDTPLDSSPQSAAGPVASALSASRRLEAEDRAVGERRDQPVCVQRSAQLPARAASAARLSAGRAGGGRTAARGPVDGVDAARHLAACRDALAALALKDPELVR
eukprot:SAG11_NODE_15818_length_565_cov_1.369099_1_plen_117_part_10